MRKSFIYYMIITAILLSVVIVGISCTNNNAVVSVQNEVLAEKYEQVKQYNIIASGGTHLVALKPNGRVVSTGCNDSGECETQSWRDIIAVYASANNTIGLKKDGTVVAAGAVVNGLGKVEGRDCFQEGWEDQFKDIIDIKIFMGGLSYEWQYVFGIKNDGTCVLAETKYGNSEKHYNFENAISELKDIMDIVGFPVTSQVYALTIKGNVLYMDETGDRAFQWIDLGISDVKGLIKYSERPLLIMNDGRLMECSVTDGQAHLSGYLQDEIQEVLNKNTEVNYGDGKIFFDIGEFYFGALNNQKTVTIPDVIFDVIEQDKNKGSLTKELTLGALNEIADWKDVVGVASGYSLDVFAVTEDGNLVYIRNQLKMDLSNMTGLGRYKG